MACCWPPRSCRCGGQPEKGGELYRVARRRLAGEKAAVELVPRAEIGLQPGRIGQTGRGDGLALAEPGKRRIDQVYGRRVKTIVADLSIDADLRRVEQAVATDESVTLLINNAGMGGIETVADADADAAEQMIKVNVVALTRLTRAVLPGLLARNRGAIINIASVVAYGIAVGGIYSGTKAYVVNFTEALQKEVAGTKVRAQVVLPGPIRTEFWDVSGISLDRINQDWIMSADEA